MEENFLLFKAKLPCVLNEKYRPGRAKPPKLVEWQSIVEDGKFFTTITKFKKKNVLAGDLF